MTASKPKALEVARRAMRQLSNAERDQMLEQYLSDGIAADKARIAELEDIISELIAGTGTSPGADRKYGRARAALAQQGKEGEC